MSLTTTSTTTTTTTLKPLSYSITSDDLLNSRACDALTLAANYSFGQVKPDGHWCGELLSNATITAEYVFLRQALGLDLTVDREALCQWFLSQQKSDGSWAIAPDYPGDISATTEAYLALKILNIPADNPVMRRARNFVISVGGVAKVRVFTRIYLATFGLFPWAVVPQLPPEFIIMPSWSPINIYKLASWARSTMIPLLIVSHHQPIFSLPNGTFAQNDFLDELWCNPAEKMTPCTPPLWDAWKTDGVAFTFAASDKILHCLGGISRRIPLRKYARRRCVNWILEHQEESGDWAGIFPPMHVGLLALVLEGFKLEDAPVRRGLEAVERFAWQDKGGKRVQACVSPVWDTILTTVGLCDSGLSLDDEHLQQAVQWIKARQLLGPQGDWRVYNPRLAPGGFSFEYSNTWYPDVDDTAAAVLALIKQDPRSIGSLCVSRACEWILGMQNRDGGWAAFDLENNKLYLNKIPFSDMDSLCDPSTADVTGRILEAFGLLLQNSRDHPVSKDLLRRLRSASKHAIKYLARTQESHGGWYGRWGSNYIYGTSNTLCGLAYFEGDSRVQGLVNPAMQWLKSVQNTDGGWGEGLDTYKDPERAGCGVSTASQTAWGIMALLPYLPPNDPVITKGISFLLRSQTDKQGNGASWPETQYTGTGFPKFFYLGYSLYSHYFPMMALGRYVRAAGRLALQEAKLSF
ncbi:MAG: hypothetical protein M1834_005059 [Cirrosporium novae-zelandiae]|nr:MAG: hypothetical protein M1834_005059 [Cirrosporium novae-zelandiae]